MCITWGFRIGKEIQGARSRQEALGGDVEVNRSCPEGPVAHEELDRPQIDASLGRLKLDHVMKSLPDLLR